MTTHWRYTENPFLNVTHDSFRKMHTLGADHEAKLMASTIPEVAALLARFRPVYAAWKLAFDAWKNFAAAHKGTTLATSNQMESVSRVEPELGSKLERWETKIAGVYPQASSKFRAIFPRGRAGLTEGTLEERVSALSQLATRVDAAGGLPAALVTEIKDFAAEAEALRQEQQKQEGLEAAARLALEPQRVALARMMYKNLGALMDLHADNPPAIEGYFDLSVLRSAGSPAPEEPDSPAPGTPPTPAP